MKLKTENPTPAMILAAREKAGLSQKEAALLLGLSHYQRWAEFETGKRPIDNVRWQWFLLQTEQHPKLALVEAA